MSLNRVMLIGNLCAKPELKHLPSGQAVCEMRVATNERWTDKEGKKQERAEFHSVVAWGKVGENCAKYLDKGRPVYLEGRITTRSWDDKETGEKRYRTEIVANTVQFLGSKGSGTTQNFEPDTGDHSSQSNGHSEPPPSSSSNSDDSIPF